MSLGHEPNLENVKSNRFIVIGNVEVTVQDFVNIWNGEDVSPVLSQNEIEYAKRTRQVRRGHDHEMGDEEDLVKFFLPRFNSAVATRLRVAKRDKIRSLIQKYHQSGQQRTVLQMDRILAALSDDMRFDDVAAFIARFSEPRAEEASIVMAAADDVNAIVEGNRRRTRYITPETVKSISNLPEDEQRAIQELLETMERQHAIIPMILLERALAGHELTDDNCAELTLYQNIGSARIVSVIQEMRVLVFGLGLVSMLAAFFVAKDPETFDLLMKGGIGVSTLGGLAHLIPTHALKVLSKRATSIQKYKAIYEAMCAKVQELNQTPAGRVQVLFLNELIRSNHQPDAKTNVDSLKPFIEFFSRNPQLVADFNDMFSSMDRNWTEPYEVLQALRDFIATKQELKRVISPPRRIAPVLDHEFEETAAQPATEDSELNTPEDEEAGRREL